MQSVLTFLNNQSTEEVVLNRGMNSLFFGFCYVWIVVEYDDIDRLLNGNTENEQDSINFIIQRSTINDVSAIFVEYQVFDNDENNPPFPITYPSLDFIQKVNIYYPNSFKNEYIGTYCIDNSCSFCDDVFADGFRLELNNEYWTNVEYFRYITNIPICLSSIELPIYSGFTKRDLRIKSISTSTKVRRLGYVKLLLRFFTSYNQVPASLLSKKFEIYCQEYNSLLGVYKNTKGAIKITKSGVSSKPYIELALKLGLIQNSIGVYQLGKLGKVYNILKRILDDLDDNPFVLTTFDTSFFLEHLLREDYMYITELLSDIKKYSDWSYKSRKGSFQHILLSKIDRLIDELSTSNAKDLLYLRSIKQRIVEWDNPETYIEHIIMPRLNWLYDMDFIDLDEHDYHVVLTRKGDLLLQSLSFINDVHNGPLANISDCIGSYYMKILRAIGITNGEIDIGNWHDFENLLNDCFGYFYTLAPNRVTISQTESYIRFCLLFKFSRVVEHNDLIKIFASLDKTNYIFKYQDQYNDGYIQKRK